MPYSEFLGDYFRARAEDIKYQAFYKILFEKAKSNKIAKSEFFSCGDKKFCCHNIEFFLKKFKVKDYKIEAIFGFDSKLGLDGAKVTGLWEIDGKEENLTVYFYYCEPYILFGWQEESVKKDMSLLLNRKINAIEVVGKNNFYETCGCFGYVEGNKVFRFYVQIWEKKPLEVFEIKSNLGKKLILKGNKPSLFQKIKYNLFSLLKYFFDFLYFTKIQLLNLLN